MFKQFDYPSSLDMIHVYGQCGWQDLSSMSNSIATPWEHCEWNISKFLVNAMLWYYMTYNYDIKDHILLWMFKDRWYLQENVIAHVILT
jgi:hypothetical protein